MSANFYNLLRTFLDGAWQLCTTWLVPGTDLTPAEFMYTGLFIVFAIRFINRLLQIDTSGGDEKQVKPNFHEKRISIKR